jgi:hypothetical protein
VTVDITIPPLTPEMVKLDVSRDGRFLLFRTYCPLTFYGSSRMTDASLPASVRIPESHYKAKALDVEGRVIIQEGHTAGRISEDDENILGEPVRCALPFKVERYIVFTRIQGFSHEDTRMRNLDQGFFVLSVVLEDVVKLHKLRAKKAKISLYKTSLGGTPDNETDSDSDEDDTAWPGP